MAIPSGTVSAKTASSPPLFLPSSAQQEDEEKLINRMLGELNEAKDILNKLAQAKKLDSDKDIRGQIDAIIAKIKKIQELIKAGQNEAALKEKRALSEELQGLTMWYGPGETEAITRANLDKTTKELEAVGAIAQKITNLIAIETSGAEADMKPTTGIEIEVTPSDEQTNEGKLIEELLGYIDEAAGSIGDSEFTSLMDGVKKEVQRIQKFISDGKEVDARSAKSQLAQSLVVLVTLLGTAIDADETKMELHRASTSLVNAFHTLQALIAAEIPPAEQERITEIPLPPEAGDEDEELPEWFGEKPGEEKSGVGEVADEHMKILAKLRQEAEVKAGEKAKSEEEAQKSQEAFEELDEMLDDFEPVLVGDVSKNWGVPTVHIEMPPLEDEALSPMEFCTPSRIDVSMFRAITENTEVEVKVTAPIMSETSEEAKEIVIAVIGSEVTLKDGGAEAETRLPLVIKENRLYAGEDENLYPINLLPGDIVSGLEIAPEEISLDSDENQNPVYKVHLKEEGRLLGFLPVELVREVTIGPSMGEVKSIEQPWWSFMVGKSEIPKTLCGIPTAPEPYNPPPGDKSGG